MAQLSMDESLRSLGSEASDGDFWLSLDAKPDLKDCSQPLLEGSTIALSAFSGFEDTRAFELSAELSKRTSKRTSPALRSPSVEERIQRKYDKSLERVRRAKNVEIANSTTLAKHNLTKKFEERLSALNRSFQQQRVVQLQELEFVKTELHRRTAEVSRLRELVGEQEVLISQLRVLKSEKATPACISRTDSMSKAIRHSESFSDFQAEVELAKAQVESLQQMLEEERSESSARNLAYRNLEEQHSALQLQSSAELSALKAELQSLQESHRAEKDNLLAQLRNIKEEAAAESYASSEIQTRLQGVVAALQEELRTAKLVLTHPRLRSKIVTRLRDVESSLIDAEEQVAPTPVHAEPRSARWSRRTRTAIRNNQSIGKVFNHKDHHAYMQSAQLQRDFERSNSRRTASGCPSWEGLEGKRI